MPYPICSVVAVFKMLIRILNTLRSRIWDMVLFLFSDYLNLWFNNMECARRLWFLIGELFHHEKIFFSGNFYSSDCLVLITNSKLVISNHRLLGNPLIPIQALNTNFHLEPNSRKAKIWYRRKCDVGASKNAGQAFSTKRLSSHFLIYQIFAFRLFSPSN